MEPRPIIYGTLYGLQEISEFLSLDTGHLNFLLKSIFKHEITTLDPTEDLEVPAKIYRMAGIASRGSVNCFLYNQI